MARNRPTTRSQAILWLEIGQLRVVKRFIGDKKFFYTINRSTTRSQAILWR